MKTNKIDPEEFYKSIKVTEDEYLISNPHFMRYVHNRILQLEEELARLSDIVHGTED